MSTNQVERQFLFPWVCRATGAFFFVIGWEPVHTCPVCGPQEPDEEDGQTSAFEQGHCYRKFSESFFADERRQA